MIVPNFCSWNLHYRNLIAYVRLRKYLLLSRLHRPGKLRNVQAFLPVHGRFHQWSNKCRIQIWLQPESRRAAIRQGSASTCRCFMRNPPFHKINLVLRIITQVAFVLQIVNCTYKKTNFFNYTYKKGWKNKKVLYIIGIETFKTT